MKKTVQIEINDNKDLSKEELEERATLLMIRFYQANEKEDFKKGLSCYAEIVDLMDIMNEKKRG